MPLAPQGIAVAFVRAFGNGEIDTMAGLLADDIVFESPRVRLIGAESVLAAMREFAQVVHGVDIFAAFGDGERAVVVYDMRTAPFGTLRAVDYLVVRDGTIHYDNLVFDTYEVRTAHAAQ